MASTSCWTRAASFFAAATAREPSTLGVHLSDLLIQLRDLPFARLGLHGVGLEGREVAIATVDGLGTLSVAGVEYRF
jgi:hypothetical protein